jgi:16S rRNA (cytidine1402-2'-O)-methyltransferase
MPRARRAEGGTWRSAAARRNKSGSGTGAASLGEPTLEGIEAPGPSKLTPEKSARGRLSPGLYLVSTPIGNLGDMTLRALDALAGADAVLCEDTRVTAKLLARHGIAAALVPYHDHNAATMRPRLVERLKQGQALALVSDAGTPLISDPGYKLVRAALAAGIAVTSLPGASAILAALQLSGLPPDRFCFLGFLPAKAQARRRTIEEARKIPATLVFYETAPRLVSSLADMKDVLGDRPAAVARELTKLFEEVRRGTLAELVAHYREAGPPKGELAVVVGPPEAAASSAASLDHDLAAALARMSLKQAVTSVARASGLRRKLVYARALALKEGR